MNDTAGTELLLVRHGRIEKSAPPAHDEGEDGPPLGSVGREQARQLAEALAQEQELAAMYVSPLRRAQETAQILEQRLGLPPILCENLREWDFSRDMSLSDRLTLRFAQIMYRCPPFRQRLAHYWTNSPALQSFVRTVMEAIQEIVRRHPGQRVILVAHGGAIDAVLSYYFPREDQWERGVIRNCSVTRIRVQGDQAELLEFNRVFGPA